MFDYTWDISVLVFALIIYLAPAVFIAWVIGRERRMGFTLSFLVCLVTSPLFGFFIVSSSGLKHAKGCNHCGNSYNEAEFCGLCGKNDVGEIRDGFILKVKK